MNRSLLTNIALTPLLKQAPFTDSPRFVLALLDYLGNVLY